MSIDSASTTALAVSSSCSRLMALDSPTNLYCVEMSLSSADGGLGAAMPGRALPLDALLPSDERLMVDDLFAAASAAAVVVTVCGARGDTMPASRSAIFFSTFCTVDAKGG